MQFRYYVDPSTGLPHIFEHGISEAEVETILHDPSQDLRGRDNSRVAIGQTEEGRYLKVIYVPDSGWNSVFVVTAYDLGKKAKRALSRKRRNKR